jgi:hypothetical protein
VTLSEIVEVKSKGGYLMFHAGKKSFVIKPRIADRFSLEGTAYFENLSKTSYLGQEMYSNLREATQEEIEKYVPTEHRK